MDWLRRAWIPAFAGMTKYSKRPSILIRFFSNLVGEKGSRIPGFQGSSEVKNPDTDNRHGWAFTSLIEPYFQNMTIYKNSSKRPGFSAYFSVSAWFTIFYHSNPWTLDPLNPFGIINSLGDDPLIMTQPPSRE